MSEYITKTLIVFSLVNIMLVSFSSAQEKIAQEFKEIGQPELQSQNVILDDFAEDEDVQEVQQVSDEFDEFVDEMMQQKSDGIAREPLKQSITIIKNANVVTNVKYTVKPGDVLSFSVYDEPELDQGDLSIRPDGYVTIRPIGEVYVSDLTIDQIEKLTKEKLRKYLNYPQVTINIQRFHPASVYVYGAVQTPGMYQQVVEATFNGTDLRDPSVKTRLNISNVVANAGGITYDADLENVEVTSLDNVKRNVNLWKFLKDGDVEQNIMLNSGDKIFIPRLEESMLINDDDFELIAKSSLFPQTFPVRVIGEVKRPGIVSIPTDTPYINSAIAMTNGFNVDARRRSIRLLRKQSNGRISKIYVNPTKIDLVLRPNDIIEVRQKKVSAVSRFADYLSRIISPFSGSAGAFNGWADVADPDRRYRSY